ncbi:MAG: nickel pincer cofactor biosynthesis protein LarB [bacterium]|nr:nickel pincer cofactor biosynthesis protein LarB [bacterium]
MDRSRFESLLKQVRKGKVGVTDAVEQLRADAFDDLGFAKVDLQRSLRRGFPEVIYGPGKTPGQIAELAQSLSRHEQTVLVTRVDREVYEAVRGAVPKAEYHETAQAIVLRRGKSKAGRRGVVVVSAGTADQRVAEEAALTAELMGNAVERIRDVGVAGLHRLKPHRDTLLGARVIVVVAGMEGALPSVIAGLTDCPVIGVPTSTGYGAGGRGEAALLAMLNSCASGLTVVNIDNGYGGGCAAALINRPKKSSKR